MKQTKCYCGHTITCDCGPLEEPKQDMKQTAVEWLLNNLISEPHSEEDFQYNSDMWDKAIEMERQQIVMAFWNSKHSLCDEDTDLLYLAEQYYNAKFKNK